MDNESCCHQGKKFLAPIIALVLIIFGVYLVSLVRNSWRNYSYLGKSPEFKDRIVVDGTGKVVAKPDVATINIGVVSEGATVAGAQKDNTEKMNAIVKAIKDEFRIAEKDIQTQNYNINPKYDWSDKVQRIIGYTVNQMVIVKVRNFDQIGDIIARGTALGANSVSGPQFTIDDPTIYKDEARQQAIARAKDKAKTLSDQVGIRLGRIVGFSEGIDAATPNYYRTDAFSLGAGEVAKVVSPNIEAGSQEIGVTVSISYEIK